MRYENKALRDLCRGQPCYLRLPGICRNDSATVVPCHSNQSRHGHGMAVKAHDVFVVPGCAACHRELDQGNFYSREERRQLWDIAWQKWMLEIWRQELIEVKR